MVSIPTSLPVWLSEIAESQSLPERIPLNEILDNSCFYPASGMDPSPIVITRGFVHSFVYVDLWMRRRSFLQEIEAVGFSGYELVTGRDVERDEIVPSNWMPEMLQYPS